MVQAKGNTMNKTKKKSRLPKTISIYVDANSQGQADGSKNRPYPTLEAARDGLRLLKRNGLKSAARVLIAPGVYRLAKPLLFTPEDSGTKECPIAWTGLAGRPVISGGRVIAGWREGEINGVKCWQAELPDVRAGKWWFTQLFVNGRRRLSARLPKQGFYRFAGVPEAEAQRDPGAIFHGAMSALFQPGEIKAFRNLADITAVVPDHWYENHLRIDKVDEALHTIHFATKGYSRFSRDETGKHTRFRLDHVLEACTDPGEWCLDRAGGTLSYIPLPGESMEKTLVEAPLLDHLLSIEGDTLDPEKRVRNLRFEFLDFRQADWELPRDNAGALQSAFQAPAAVRLVGAEDCALYGCHVSQVAGWAVEVLRGCRRNRIAACALYDLGGGGVKIGPEGGLERSWVDGSHGAFRGMDHLAYGWGPCREDRGGALAGRNRVASSATTVSDCSIHDGGIIFHSAVGIWVGDASRNRILHNHIYNFSYSGISCGWTWGFAPAYTHDNRIEGNHIHGIGHGILSDMGAIYTLGRQAGGTIARNFIHDVHSYGYGGWGIYTDEGSSWLTIEDNVVCHTKCGGFHQHYGRDNIVRRNIFADAIENQVQVTRRQMVRALIFENNLAQGAGNGALWQGGGWQHSRIDRNIYAADIGRPGHFCDMTWEVWQKNGSDRNGRFIDAMLLDSRGSSSATANPDAFKAAGIDPKKVARIVAAAGPRARESMPPSSAAFEPERERPRPIIEPLLWPWPAEWPHADNTAHPWSTDLPETAVAAPDRTQAVSLTLENRGDAPAKGTYKLRVVPANAARLKGPATLKVTLKPGARAALDTAVIPTGKESAFRIEATANGAGFYETCLYFSVPKTVDTFGGENRKSI